MALSIFPDPVTKAFKPGWQEIGGELKSLLTDDEYASARRTTFNAFYTSETVIEAMHAALARLGVPEGATVLEPGCAVGRFIRPGKRFIGVELDSVSGRIAKVLHPEADIRIEDFQNTKLPSLDAVIGNVPFAHRKQKRKYTGEPYANHCEVVSRIVAKYTSDPNVIAAACLHDVIEDTEVTADELRAVFGDRITDLVLEVTDVSRPGDGNREARKAIDREHLTKSSFEGATIKLADLIDNTSSIVMHDPNFARVYLAEKELVLPLLKHGNPGLWALTNETLIDAQRKLAERRE